MRPPSSREGVGRSARSTRSTRSTELRNVPERRLSVADAEGERWVLELLDPGSLLYLSLDGQRGNDTLGGMSKSSSARVESFVLYVRVSTEEQGLSGLGLDAQLASCRSFVEQQGGRIVEEVREVESGANDARPGLARAMALASRTRGTLLVAKLDRLGRSVALVASTLKSGQKVRVAEHPDASTLELHLRAVIAEEERRLIGERTRAALEQAKRRGVALGSSRPGHWEGREDRRLAGGIAGAAAAVIARRERAAGLLEQARPIVEANADASLRALGEALRAAGVLTAQGCEQWTPASVKRLRAQLGLGVRA